MRKEGIAHHWRIVSREHTAPREAVSQQRPSPTANLLSSLRPVTTQRDCEFGAVTLLVWAAPKIPPSPSSFLADAWANSDFGLTLFVRSAELATVFLPLLQEVERERKENGGGNILSNLLVAKSRQLRRARAHDVIRGGNVLPGPEEQS